MRLLALYEKKKHGCQYCLHITPLKHEGEIRNACPFDECPYHVLDKYESYEKFMASEDSKILVSEFFTYVADCYELSTPNTVRNRVFSDGDATMHI